MAAPASDLASQGWATGPYTPTAAVRACVTLSFRSVLIPSLGCPLSLLRSLLFPGFWLLPPAAPRKGPGCPLSDHCHEETLFPLQMTSLMSGHPAAWLPGFSPSPLRQTDRVCPPGLGRGGQPQPQRFSHSG